MKRAVLRERKRKRDELFPLLYQLNNGFDESFAFLLDRMFRCVCKSDFLDFKNGRWCLDEKYRYHYLPKLIKPRVKKLKPFRPIKVTPIIQYQKA
jgi:hypothetical protein